MVEIKRDKKIWGETSQDKTPMPYDWDVLKISWCREHKEYWVMNCPECMAEDTLVEGIEKGRQQVIEWGNEPCDSCHFFHKHRKDCPLCWAELEKEANSG